MKPKTILITGGARSGKSSYALILGKNAEKPCFIATGWATDPEMEERIQKHKQGRDSRWRLIETRTKIAEAIRTAERDGADFILVDCLTLWTSNIMLEQENSVEEMAEELAGVIRKNSVPLVFVTNEVGSGIVPESELARKFRDNAGYVNRIVADAVDRLYLMVCGHPLKVK